MATVTITGILKTPAGAGKQGVVVKATRIQNAGLGRALQSGGVGSATDFLSSATDGNGAFTVTLTHQTAHSVPLLYKLLFPDNSWAMITIPIGTTAIDIGTLPFDAGFGDITAIVSMNRLTPTVLFKGLTADETRVSTTTLSNTALSVTVEAATQYAIEMLLLSTNVNALPKFDLAGGTCTETSSSLYITESYNNNTSVAKSGGATISTGFSGSFAAIPVRIELQGTILTSAAGTLILRFAQNATDAGENKILKGSFIRLTKIT
jgi:hypothetical protein